MSISFSGLASGLDTASWIEALTSIKRLSVTSLESKQSSLNASQSSLNSVKGLFTQLQAALEKITDSAHGSSSDIFVKKMVDTEGNLTYTASVTSDAVANSYNIFVQQLATCTRAQSVDSVAKYVSTNTKMSDLGITSGNLTFYVAGGKHEITVDSSKTLGELFTQLSAEGVNAGINENGRIVLEGAGNTDLSLGLATDTSNLASILGLTRKIDTVKDAYYYSTARSVYAVGLNTKIAGNANLFNGGTLTNGKFTIGNATFEITSDTTLGSLINEINSNDESFVSATWDSTAGKLLLTSKVEGESFINLQIGDEDDTTNELKSNFTTIFGFTDSSNNLISAAQDLGQNAIITIDGGDNIYLSGDYTTATSTEAASSEKLVVGESTMAISKDLSELTAGFNYYSTTLGSLGLNAGEIGINGSYGMFTENMTIANVVDKMSQMGAAAAEGSKFTASWDSANNKIVLTAVDSGTDIIDFETVTGGGSVCNLASLFEFTQVSYVTFSTTASGTQNMVDGTLTATANSAVNDLKELSYGSIVSSPLKVGASNATTSTLLSALGVNNSVVSINGNNLAIDSSWSIQNLVDEINSRDLGVTALYDSGSAKFTIRSNTEGENVAFENISGNFASKFAYTLISSETGSISNMGVQGEVNIGGDDYWQATSDSITDTEDVTLSTFTSNACCVVISSSKLLLRYQPLKSYSLAPVNISLDRV